MAIVDNTVHVSQRILGVVTLNTKIIDEIVNREDLNKEANYILKTTLIIPSIILTLTLGSTNHPDVILLLMFGTLIYSIIFMMMFRYSLFSFAKLTNRKINHESLYRIFPYSFIMYPFNSFFILYAAFGQPSLPMYGVILLQVGLISFIIKKSLKSNSMIIFTFISFLLASLAALTAMISTIFAAILLF